MDGSPDTLLLSYRRTVPVSAKIGQDSISGQRTIRGNEPREIGG